jgi:hypothetical protein
MAVNSYDPTTGRPIFIDTDPPDIKVDPTEAAKYAADVGNRIVRPNLAALEAYEFKRAGLEGVAEDTGAVYGHNGSGWGSRAPRIGMRRSTQTGTVSSSVYTDLSASSFWVEEYRSDMPEYSGGITVPASGVYEISYTVSAVQGLLVGVVVNKSTGISVADLKLVATSTTVQGVATASTSGKVALSAGDVVRLFGIAGAAGATWRTDAGLSSFQVEWS